MEYLYSTKNRTLTGKIKCRIKTFHLTKLEERMLLALANNETNTFEELDKFMRGGDIKPNKFYIRRNKMYLCKKYKLDIESVKGVGYKLYDTVKIN